MVNQNSVEKAELTKSCLLTPKILKRMPFSIYDHMTFYVSDMFVFCGGHKRPGLSSNQCFGVVSSPGANWTAFPNIPRFIFNSAKTTVGDKAFLIGGFDKEPVDSVYSFDSKAEKWEEGVKLSLGRSSACAVSYGDTLYVTGGKKTAVAPESNNLETVEKLKVGKDENWIALPNLIHKRHSNDLFLFFLLTYI